MKKIINYILIATLVVTLSGCTLAEDDAYYENNIDTMGVEDYYIPSGMRFRLRFDNSSTDIHDTEEYFGVSFACEGRDVFDNCAAVRAGKSIVSGGTHIHVTSNTVNGEKQADEQMLDVDLTFYARSNNSFIIQVIPQMQNSQGDVIEEESSFIHFETGSSMSSSFEGVKEDGTIHRIEYKINFVTIDELELVTVRQFDDSDNLIKEMVIPKDETIESLQLEYNTAYYFILEDFVTDEGARYRERTYKSADEYFAYVYLYTNEYGYLIGDRLIIS